MTLYTFWAKAPHPGNLGDVLTPVVLRGLGVDVAWAEPESADLLAIGSIIDHARPGQAVWGSGAMWEHDRPSPNARYLAVRGPLTRDVVHRAGGDCPEVYGDPALLLPFVHCGPVRTVHEVGYVPHYVDVARVRAMHPDAFVIDPVRADPLEVVDEIRSCARIYSSSLHGIVIAHAYGIPAAWVEWSDRLDGDGTKFRDYGLSVGLDLSPAPDVDRAELTLKSLDPWPLLDALDGIR